MGMDGRRQLLGRRAEADGQGELGDYVGLDIVLAIMDVIYKETGDPKYRACPLLRKMVRAKKLGVKTGIGFYNYADGGKVPTDKQ